MKKNLYLILLIISGLFFGGGVSSFATGDVSIIPQPQKITVKEGTFQITKGTQFIVPDEKVKEAVSFFTGQLERVTGWEVKTTMSSGKRKNVIRFEYDPSLAEEAYSLDVRDRAIYVKASGFPGFFYSMQTLRQLLPVDFEGTQLQTRKKWDVPQVLVEDQPRFKWRGFMLDVSRHFFPKEDIIKLIDHLAFHKINVFHWHLVDVQGWRIEIKKYPKLTDISAWRVDREQFHWNARPYQEPGEKTTYGGFYTQEEIKEVVAYAQSKAIEVVPEIEMPSHSNCVFSAYPELSCTGGPFTTPPGNNWPKTDIYCAGNEKVFSFLEDVLSEVMALFPSKYIHIGGDEAHKGQWEKCPKCQARLKEEGLADCEELQSYFVKRIEKYLNSKGRILLGWDEILQGGLAPNATVMSWRGFKGGIEAAQQGHDVIMTPVGHCYFDHYQGPMDQEPIAWGAWQPLKKVYDFEPVPKELNPSQAHHVIGGQANLWSEYVPTFNQLQYQTFPRIAALSESVWSPSENKDWNSFSRRMEDLYPRYQQMGIHYSNSAYYVVAKSATKEGAVQVELTAESPVVEIRYTLDGTTPTSHSALYTKALKLDATTNLRAATFVNGKATGNTLSRDYVYNKASGKKVNYLIPCHKNHPGVGSETLTNTIRGGKRLRASEGYWQGWEGDNMEVVIDLETATDVSRVSLGCLQDPRIRAFLPGKVEVSVSEDGKEFSHVGEAGHSFLFNENQVINHEFVISFKPGKARFVKVVAHNLGTAPKGHMWAGRSAWLFVDEIIVE